MIINPSKVLHSTVDHGKAQTPPELRRQHEAVMNELARKAGQVWDGGTPPPRPQAPLPNK